MAPITYSTSIITTEADPDAILRTFPLAEDKSIAITVEYFAISATGKRISGVARAVFTNVFGTATILDAQVDPYQKKDAAGFGTGALAITASAANVRVGVVGYGGQGDTPWSLLITYSIL